MYFAALALLALAPAANAASWTVTTTSDPDPATATCPSMSDCSLRKAFAVAADGDTIVLGAGTYVLSRGDLITDVGLTLVGAGSAATTIDASTSTGSHRVLRVRGVVDHPMILRNLAMTGGAITTTGPLGGGGAIANNTEQPLYLSGVRVHGNAATVSGHNGNGGGGIRSQGSVYLTNTIVEGNTLVVTNTTYRSGGGGVFVAEGSGHGNLVLDRSIIRGNTATIDSATPPTGCNVPIPNTTCPSNHGGGGAYVEGEDLVMTDSSIDGNTLVVTNAYAESGGGGAFVEAGNATLVRSTMSGNRATVTTTTDPTRPASNEGGGALYLNGHDISITDSTLAGNALTVYGDTGTSPQDATNGGGAIYQFGNRLTIAGSTLSGNTASLPASKRSGGGAVYDNGNSSEYVNSTFASNSTDVGPNSDAADPETNGGGAIFLVGVRAGVTLANVTMAGNSAPNAAGGGLMAHTNAGPTWPVVENSIFAGNTSGRAGSANCYESSGHITSLGYNLADDTANSCQLTATGDQIVASAGLGALQDNGGRTATMALAPTSPAVDAGDPAGCSAAVGPLVNVDQRGVARPSPAGSRCDIGAYELAAATAETHAATGLARGIATLNGTASNPDAKGATAYFEYGRTTAYGSTTPATTLVPLAPAASLSSALSGLAAGTWHYRLVVVGAAATTRGADATFTTPPVALTVRSATTRAIRVRVAVNGAGTVRVTGARGKARACSTTRTFAQAGTATVTCSLNRATRRVLGRRSATIAIVATFTPTTGAPSTATTTVVLRREVRPVRVRPGGVTG